MHTLIDLRRLRYFQAIARYKSLSEAARRLNVTQPALTHHINVLEASLDLRLLDRQSRGIELTEAGRALAGHAERILNELRRAEDDMRRYARKARVPQVRIAVTPAVSASLAPALLSVAADFTDLTVLITEVRTKEASDLLSDDQADVAVCVLDEATQADAIELLWDPLVFVSANRPTSGGPSISLRAVVEHRLILPTHRRTLRPRINTVLAELGLAATVVAEIDGIDARKQAVLSGLGDTITSYQNVVRECRTGQLHARMIVDPPLLRLIALKARDDFPPKLLDRIVPLLRGILDANRLDGEPIAAPASV